MSAQRHDHDRAPTAEQQTGDEFGRLLEKNAPFAAQPASLLHGVMLGQVAGVMESRVMLSLPEISDEPVECQSVQGLGSSDIGKTCAVQFINGDISRPLIIGLLMQSHAQAPQEASDSGHTKAIAADRPKRRVVIQAEDELILQCGDASITLNADGLLRLRALYIDNHARATQRVRGGSVQIN